MRRGNFCTSTVGGEGKSGFVQDAQALPISHSPGEARRKLLLTHVVDGAIAAAQQEERARRVVAGDGLHLLDLAAGKAAVALDPSCLCLCGGPSWHALPFPLQNP